MYKVMNYLLTSQLQKTCVPLPVCLSLCVTGISLFVPTHIYTLVLRDTGLPALPYSILESRTTVLSPLLAMKPTEQGHSCRIGNSDFSWSYYKSPILPLLFKLSALPTPTPTPPSSSPGKGLLNDSMTTGSLRVCFLLGIC